MSKFYELNVAKQEFYASMSIGGSNGDIVPSDTVANKYIGLRVGTGGTVKVTKANGQVQEFLNVQSGEYMPIAVSLVWATVDTGVIATNIIGMCGWAEEIASGILEA